MDTFNPEHYVNDFNIIGVDEKINCDFISTMLYAAYLKKFDYDISAEELELFNDFYGRVLEFVENTRELDVTQIQSILTYLDSRNAYLVDITIIMWCLPPDTFLSQNRYHANYKDNISKYNHKILTIIEHQSVMNFCVETLTKTNNVPLHCIDYLWYYIRATPYPIEFVFYNSTNTKYVGITYENEKIIMGANFYQIIKLGLGNISNTNDPLSVPLKVYLRSIFLDIHNVRNALASEQRENFIYQLDLLLDPALRFAEGYENYVIELKQLISDH